MNLLFLCSFNKWRSPTAEQLWRNSPEHNVRSAGLSSKARRTVTAKDICWADIIFVMEQKHKNRLCAYFDQFVRFKNVYVLDIPDEYHYMEPELIEILDFKINSYLSNEFSL